MKIVNRALLFALSGIALSGCMSVYDGDKVFAISAQKFIIGKGIAEAENEIPEGATVLQVAIIKGPILGLTQQTYISGTK